MIVNGFDGDALGEIRAACACLFSQAAAESGNFITSLNLDMVKKAYRRNARLHHPDMDRQRAVNNVTSDRFLAIQHSYQTLTNYLEARSPSSDPSPPRGKIIAVGGAKGGIGKSVITANLGIHLSSLGFRTVLVDLDLGGSNLHLYLGHRAILQNTINDFLRKRVASLDEVMVKSDHGPLLIGGDSSELGSANIDFMKKTKLVRAIHAIDADLVILDLGGDTSFNILDFFLQADYSIVVTTRDSASYIGAYHFLKAALYRKLNRLSGRESRSGEGKNTDLERFIREATMSDKRPERQDDKRAPRRDQGAPSRISARRDEGGRGIQPLPHRQPDSPWNKSRRGGGQDSACDETVAHEGRDISGRNRAASRRGEERHRPRPRGDTEPERRLCRRDRRHRKAAPRGGRAFLNPGCSR
ncbi:MAG: AAA family ATPase [Syntrophales bacterium]